MKRLPLTLSVRHFNLRSTPLYDLLRRNAKGDFSFQVGSILMSKHGKTTKSILFLLFVVLSSFEMVAAAEWPDTRIYGPFICRADFAMGQWHKELSELEGLQSELMQTLYIAPAKSPIEVYLLHDEATYRRYLTQIYPNLPFRRAFFIKEKGVERVFAFKSSQFEIDLRHECTHALLHAALPNVPLWLDEGLASYYQIPTKERVTKSPYYSSTLWNARFGILPSLDNLEKIDNKSTMGKIEYRDSWAWIHFMCQESTPAHEELVGYLQDLVVQESPELLSIRLARRIPLLQVEFKRSLKEASNSRAALK
jgi:hypothetical protein